MKFFILASAMVAVALADKPAASPVYKADAKEKKADARSDQYGAPAAPSAYGAPAAPAAPDTYGSPQAPTQDEYGSPQAPVQDEYGSPQAAPVTPAPAQAAGSVGTQGFYYYYYPVASSYGGGSGGGHGSGGHAAKPAADATGGLSPIVLILGGLGLLVLLGLLAAAVGGGLGRSFQPESLLSTLSGLDMDDLTDLVYSAVRKYQGVEFQ